MGSLDQIKQDFPAAKAAYEVALSLDPRHANCLYNYGVLFDSGLRVRVGEEGVLDSTPLIPTSPVPACLYAWPYYWAGWPQGRGDVPASH